MRNLLKWVGIVLGSIVVLGLIGFTVIYFTTESRLHKVYALKVQSFPITSDPIAIEQGRHLGIAVAKCVECHGDNLGGKVMVDAPIGRLVAPNITTGEGSRVRNYTDVDWIRAIRHGVDPKGRALWIMPAEEFAGFSSEELTAIVSYVRSVPPVNNTSLPSSELTPLGRILFGTGGLPLLPAELMDHNAPPPPTPTPGVTVEYGKHMARTGGCIGCHGPNYSGGPIPGGPPDWPLARNITPDPTTGLGKWTEADFFRALREGKRPNGDTISTIMPWRYTAQLKDDEIRALWMYLRTIPPKPEGNR